MKQVQIQQNIFCINFAFSAYTMQITRSLASLCICLLTLNYIPSSPAVQMKNHTQADSIFVIFFSLFATWFIWSFKYLSFKKKILTFFIFTGLLDKYFKNKIRKILLLLIYFIIRIYFKIIMPLNVLFNSYYELTPSKKFLD